MQVQAAMEAAVESKEHTESAFLRDVKAGLSQPQKTLPCKYFYNARGSKLFEAITEQPEYYITRTELTILQEAKDEMAELIGENACIIEPGSGAGEKIKTLLAALENPALYVPIDISESALNESAVEIKRRFPTIKTEPLVRDFTERMHMPDLFAREENGKRVIFFPGSTLGNFSPEEAVTFLTRFGYAVGEGGLIIIGIDLVKETEMLEAAYDDAAGVTADFNKNLLVRMEEELDAEIVPEQFAHQAVFNPDESRIEMHLKSLQDQEVALGDERFAFKKGETIHTENSYKYTPESFPKLAQEAGLTVRTCWTDEGALFAVYALEV